jgi:hypothetical protein
MNPPEGLLLAGYPNQRPNTGVVLDLCARAAVFGDAATGAPMAALLVMDTIGVNAELARTIRQRAAAAAPGLPPESVLVSATHTHSAPRLIGFGRPGAGSPGPDQQYVQTAIEAATRAISAAWASRGEVKARIGRAEARLGHNRRLVDAEGHAKPDWLDPEARHTGYFNPAIPFVTFHDAAGGAIRAIIVSYGCHPVVMGPPNLKVSADYPGYMVGALEAATGARTAIHVTGGAGNINPRECLYDDPARASAMGEAIAKEVLAALRRATPIAVSPIRSVSVALKLLLGSKASERHAARAQEGPEGRYVQSEVQALRLGELAFVTAPGELFAEIATAMVNTSPFRHTIVVSCANDSLGYLSTDTALREGGYEPGHAVSDQIERPLIAAAREALDKALEGPVAH